MIHKYIKPSHIRILANEETIFYHHLEKVIAIPRSSRMPEEKIYFIEGVFLEKYKILLFSDRSENMLGEFTLFKDNKAVFHNRRYLKGLYVFDDFFGDKLDIYINFDQTIDDQTIGTKTPLATVGFYAQYRYEEEEKDV